MDSKLRSSTRASPFNCPKFLSSLEEMASGAAIASIAGYMVRQYADRVKIKQRGSTFTLRLHFEQ